MQIYGWLILGISAIAGGFLLFTDKPTKLKLLKTIKSLFIKDSSEPEEPKAKESIAEPDEAKSQLDDAKLKVNNIEKKMERLAQRNDVEGLKVLSRERDRLLAEIESYKAREMAADSDEYAKQLLAKYQDKN